MLRLIDGGEGFPEWSGSDAFSARVTALFNTYGARSFACFWYQQCGEEITAVVSRVDGDMTVSTSENADFNELREFVDIVGFKTLTCEKGVAQSIGIEPVKASHIAEYKDGAAASQYDSTVDMRALYSLLCACGFDMVSFEDYLADFCARLNKGTACLAAIHSNGEIVASACALFIGSRSVLLGAVATRADMRGRGLAGSLVSSLAAELANKRAYVFCRENSLLGFYEKLGFCRAGEWAICERNQDE